MSFFKKLTDEFKGLKANFDDKPKHEDKHEDNKAFDSHNTSQLTQDPYAAQHQLQDPPQTQQYNAPPPSSSAPPSLPPGWITQYDQASQRWYYVEQSTGRTQWDPPHNPNAGYPPPHADHDTSRGHDASSTGGFYNQYGSAMPAGAPHGGQYGHDQNSAQYYGDAHSAEKHGEKKKDNGTRNMMLAGAGGLAVGGVAGAMIAGDSDSDDGHGASHGGYAAQPSGYGAPPPQTAHGSQDPYAAQQQQQYPPAAHDSDAESLHEAQQDYNEAAANAADSDASSSDHEELQEAREELEEEQEEYDD